MFVLKNEGDTQSLQRRTYSRSLPSRINGFQSWNKQSTNPTALAQSPSHSCTRFWDQARASWTSCPDRRIAQPQGAWGNPTRPQVFTRPNQELCKGEALL